MGPAVPQPRRELLPLLDEEWEWKSFERFCLGYVLLQPDVVEASLYGKRGEKQKGIDVLATLRDGRTRTYQCRRYKRFSLKQTKKTVDEHEYRTDEHAILLACEAPRGVREWISGQAGWSVEDVEDISAAVRRRLPRQLARELVEDTFGPQVRRAFLGPDGPLAFFSPRRYFEPYLRAGRLLHQRAELVGRDAELSALREAVDRPDVRIVLLAGVGGGGKTRLLRELTTALEQQKLPVLVASEAVELTVALVDDLPRESLCVIVDDAHAREDLAPLLVHGRRADPALTIVLATRPHRVDELLARARLAGFEGSEIARPPVLRSLDEQLLEQIAAELLDEQDPRAHELAKAADASPLVCVVGAELLKRDQIPAVALRTKDEFREEVLGRFSDELLGEVGISVPAPVARGLLELVAAVGPVSVEDQGFVAQAAELLSIIPADARRALAELEAVGLLEARGRLRRVTPDVLADRMLAGAALDASGEPTGYIDELYDRFGDRLLESLLINAALLDWQARRGQGRLLERVWQRLTERFDESRPFDRVQLLERLRPIAVLQPRQALTLARHAIASGTPTEQYSPISEFTSGQTEVDRAAISLLEGAARHADLLEQVMPLLWQLGRVDLRPVAQTSGHPLKVLTSIGDYGRPRGHAEALLGFVERLVRARADQDAVVPAISLLRPLLAREVERVESSGPWQISTASVSVLAEATAPLRRRVRELLVDRALHADIAERLLAVELLADGMRHPYGLFGRPVSDEELNQWQPDQLALVEVLERIFEQTDEPLIRNRIRSRTRWHAEHSLWPGVAERSAALVASPPSLDERLLAETVEGWDLAEGIEQMLARRRSTADELVEAMPDGRQVAERLHGLVTRAQAAGLNSSGVIFVAELACRHPSVCAEVVDWILEKEASPLDGSLAALLEGLRQLDRDAAVTRAQRLFEMTPPRRVAAASYAVASGPLTDPAPDEEALLDRVLADDQAAVREVAATGIMRLAHWGQQRERTKALLLGFDPHGDPSSADHLASAISDFGVDGFDETELTALLTRFDVVPTLGYHAQRLVEEVGQRRAGMSVELLLRRLRAASEDREAALRFDAIPDRELGPELLAGAGSAGEYRDLVRRLRDEYPGLSGSARFTLASGLWSIVGEPWVAVDLLGEWLLEGNEGQRWAALAVLGEMPWRHLFTLAFPVALLLERLTLISAATAAELAATLRSVAQAGSWQRTPGRPAERHIETRDLALEVAQRVRQLPVAAELYEQIAADAARGMVEDAQRDDEERMLFGR